VGVAAGGVDSSSSTTERHLNEESDSKVTKLVRVQTVIHILLQCVRDLTTEKHKAVGIEGRLYEYILCTVKFRNVVIV
jgi:hypothetical protein